MEGRFHVDRCTRATTPVNYDNPPALGPNRPVPPWQFVIEIEGLLRTGSEPDPLFFVESWSHGVPAAVENFQRDGMCKRIGNAAATRSITSTTSEANLSCRSAIWMQSSSLLPHATPMSGASTPGARSSPRKILPGGHKTQLQANGRPQRGGYAGGKETTRAMTPARACELLGVSATSTRGQIKGAYRHLVSQWHPDRLGSTTEELRQFATHKMVQINAAYRLLRSGMRRKSI